MNKKKLRYYQRDCVAAVRARSDDCVIRLFCGTGKSVIICELLAHCRFGVLVVPSLLLIFQFLTYLEHAPQDVFYFCAGSRHNRAPELVLGAKRALVLCTNLFFQKLFMEEGALARARPELVVFDEAHHWAEPVRALARSRKVYVSATPVLYSGVPLAFDYPYPQALADGVVAPYKLVFAMYEPGADVEAAQLAVIRGIQKQFDRRRVLIYNHNMVKVRATKTASQAVAALAPEVRVFAADLPQPAKQELLEWFCAGPSKPAKFMCNVGTIREGVDLSCIDLVVFCDQKLSAQGIVQALGRGTRLDPTNPKKELFLLMLHPRVERQIFFKKAVRVLREVREVDARAQRLNYFEALRDCAECCGIFVTTQELF